VSKYKRWALSNTIIKLPVPKKKGGFSMRTLSLRVLLNMTHDILINGTLFTVSWLFSLSMGLNEKGVFDKYVLRKKFR
jgi:uncharacterized membrane protein